MLLAKATVSNRLSTVENLPAETRAVVCDTPSVGRAIEWAACMVGMTVHARCGQRPQERRVGHTYGALSAQLSSFMCDTLGCTAAH